MAKRVLIITYYWPPSAGSGVQRWLKFAKYLPEYGWEPVIFTPENPDFELRDESLLDEIPRQLEVLKFPIWEPYQLFRNLKKEKLTDPGLVLEKGQPSILDRFAIWLRANLLVPDPRKFWIKPASSFLIDLARKGQFDAMVTTGPPHSMHLVGLEIKNKTGLPWLADFRDPWSEWEFLEKLPMLPFIKKKHMKLEAEVLRSADAVCTISPTFQKDFENISHRSIHLLTNGFDPDDLPEDWSYKQAESPTLEILYTGIIDAIRNPIPFLDALKEVYEKENREVTLRFVGKVSEAVKEKVQNDPWLSQHIKFEGYLPHHEVFRFYRNAHLLLLVLTDTQNAKGNIPGKIFEYMATGRPIIALGDPTGDSAKLLSKSGLGKVFSHQDTEGIKAFLKDYKKEHNNALPPGILQYSRKELTQNLSQILNEITDSIS